MASQDSLVVVLCDTGGMISRVLRDDFNLKSRLYPGQSWTLLLDAASLDKGLMFFAEISEREFATGWELNVRLSKEVTPLHFSGGRVEEHILIVGAADLHIADKFYEDELLVINNEQANLIRSLVKEKSTIQRDKNSQDVLLEDAGRLQEIFLDDAAKLNNELVTLQRKLTKANRELEQKQRLLESIMGTMPDVLYTIDLDDSILLFSNRSISSVLGYAPDEEADSDSPFFETYLHPEDLPHLPDRLEKYQQTDDGAFIETDYRLKHVSGSWRWFRSRDTVFERDSEGTPTQIMGIAQDITVHKLMQEKLWNLSTRDALTGLYNRTYFDGELERLQNSRQFPVSIVMIDINDLKVVNDKLGHAAGDEMLRCAAEVLSKAFRTDDIVARIGGDEFAVLLPKTDSDLMPHILERIRNFTDEHNKLRGGEITLSLAVGYATADQPEQLRGALKLADERMYSNKASSKSEPLGKKEDTDARIH
jgi:diguanylate cyclase (GGDEF)-like protein/PAS domain S-box-containing protein